ncbi:MAG: flavodoxin family protein [Actinomycetota bacterium]
MRALIIVESVFGNTKRIGAAIAAGMAPVVVSDVVGVDAPIDLADVDLVIVGGPTYDHGLSGPFSRKAAKGQAGIHPVNLSVGLREFLDSVGDGGGRAAAAFDTRFSKPKWLTGSAATQASRRLRRIGFSVVSEPKSFFVEAMRGPLAEGELDRARAWGERLAAQVAGASQRQQHRAA